MPAQVIDMHERKTSAEEQAAFDGKPVYKRKPCSFTSWEEAGEPPAREWAIEDWIGMGYTTLLAGMGGVGKSLLSQQTATALCISRFHISHIRTPRVVLMWAGEDDEEELNRRQTAICQKFDIPRRVLDGHFFLESMVDTDCTLMEMIQGTLSNNPFMLKELREQVGDYKAEVVILDNTAKLFGGNENDRYQVGRFLTAIRRCMQPTKAACILLSHPAKAQGSEYSGSTAWENAVRARLFFGDKPPDAKEANSDDEAPTDLRYLAKRKVNYTSKEIITLRHERGAYEMMDSPSASGLVGSILRERADRVIVNALRTLLERNVYCSDSTASPSYLPTLILSSGLADGLTKKDLSIALRHAIVDGRILLGKTTHQNPSNRAYKSGTLLP